MRGADAARAPVAVRGLRAGRARGDGARRPGRRRRRDRAAGDRPATPPSTSIRSTPSDDRRARSARRWPRAPTWPRAAARARRSSRGGAPPRRRRRSTASCCDHDHPHAQRRRGAPARALAAGRARAAGRRRRRDRQRLHRPHATLCERHGARASSSCASGVSYAAAMNAGLAPTSGDRGAAAQRRLRARRRLPRRRARRASTRPASARSRRCCCAPPGWSRRDRSDIVDAAGMTIDRRRKNSLVGHGEPRARHCRRPARRSAATARASCTGARRSTRSPSAPRSSTRTWRCGPATPTSPGACATPAGAASTSPRRVAWHVRFYCPGNRAAAGARAPPPAVPQPAADDRQERDRPRRCARDAPCILGYEVLALGHALLRERALLGGYVDAARLLGAARSRRRARPPQ